MNRLLLFLSIILTAAMANAQNTIEITVNGRTMTATLADTDAARQFGEKLENGSITVKMNDYGGFEKVGDLPWSLPTSNRQLTTSAGDIMLYVGRSIVIFYGPNSWDYTPLGKIDGASASEIRSFLSGNSVDATFSINAESAINDVVAASDVEPEIVTLQGHKIILGDRKLSDLPGGFYIINGKKQFIK